jgi:hypothetical protein
LGENSALAKERIAWGSLLDFALHTQDLHSHSPQLHLEFESGFYQSARGNARQLIFQDDDDRRQFLQLLAREFLQPSAAMCQQPFASVANRFGVSPCWISKIQHEAECTIRSPQRRNQCVSAKSSNDPNAILLRRCKTGSYSPFVGGEFLIQ